ncbi:DNA-binding response regulator [Thiocapsa imhoffii]|uniref:DNA-binding response regulator n=1 Tax=Thiocapsa imhoffii TaxID=382777 RepID=A0A9X1B7Y7_9GAMM|nr:response regulator [Thiocapsa imhoffii]MBK1643713.1 DNA-binding response regulator [Thiocapsa imhoffii]
MSTAPVAFIVDDDPALRDALCMLLESVSIHCRSFAGAEELLLSGALMQAGPACLIADVRMPGISGMTLLERLRRDGIRIPTIVVTAYGDIPMAVRAMKLGAVDFITKPIDPQAVLELVQKTLETLTTPRAPDAAAKIETQLRCYATLTPREQQIFQRITAGESNRMVADALGISIRTAELHRARVMKKMQAQNLAELTLIWVSIQDHLGQDGAASQPERARSR